MDRVHLCGQCREAISSPLSPAVIARNVARWLPGERTAGFRAWQRVLDDAGWRVLTLRLGRFFLFLAGLNELVWRNLDTDAWVKFKVFGLMPLTFVFFLLQAPLMRRHALAPEGETR